MADPELLILDEPTNGLDFLAREELLDSIGRIAERPDAPTILYVTHHIEEILPAFNKTLLLREGQIFGADNTDELVTKDRMSEFFGIPVNVIWDNGRPLLSKAQGVRN